MKMDIQAHWKRLQRRGSRGRRRFSKRRAAAAAVAVAEEIGSVEGWEEEYLVE